MVTVALAYHMFAAGYPQHLLQQCVRQLIQRFAAQQIPGRKIDPVGFFSASVGLVAIFIVGTGEANGVPRPVENSTSCAPEAASAVEATRSFPGAESRFSPGAETGSP